MAGKKSQQKLQLALAVVLVAMVFLVEWVGQTPKGVYIHPKNSPFLTGMTRDKALEKVNQMKAIREIRTCDPVQSFVLTSRKGFDLSPDLAGSRAWILMDKKERLFWLGFKDNALAQILYLNDPDAGKQQAFLALACAPELAEDPAAFLQARTPYPVFTP